MHGELRLDIEAVAEYLGVDDIERLIDGLHALAEHQQSLSEQRVTSNEQR